MLQLAIEGEASLVAIVGQQWRDSVYLTESCLVAMDRKSLTAHKIFALRLKQLTVYTTKSHFTRINISVSNHVTCTYSLSTSATAHLYRALRTGRSLRTGELNVTHLCKITMLATKFSSQSR
jgi:PIN domain nuclease of toxin-antitoxin system